MKNKDTDKSKNNDGLYLILPAIYLLITKAAICLNDKIAVQVAHSKIRK
jgi:hypothetical protein